MTVEHASFHRESAYEAAQQWMRDHVDEAISPVTLKGYRREWRRLVGEQIATGESLRLLTVRTGTDDDWSVAQAAIFWRSRTRLARLLRCKSLQASGMPGAAMRVLRATGETLQMLEEIGVVPELVRRGLRRRASRLDLLPEDWQEQLLLHAQRRQRLDLLLFSLTGARPSELRAGPRFRIISGPEGETLELSIAGAKRADRTGQDVRILTMSSSGSEAARVQDLIAHLAGLKATVRVNTLELAGCVTISAEPAKWIPRLARSIWPDVEVLPTPYSFRYAFRQKCGANGTDRQHQALAMGHQATQSAGSYGRSKAPRPGAIAGLQIKGASRPRQQQELIRAISEASKDKVIERERSRQRELFDRGLSMER